MSDGAVSVVQAGEGTDVPSRPVLWTIADLQVELGMKRTASFALVKEPGFPKPVRLHGENSHRRWYSTEVLAYVEGKRLHGADR